METTNISGTINYQNITGNIIKNKSVSGAVTSAPCTPKEEDNKKESLIGNIRKQYELDGTIDANLGVVGKVSSSFDYKQLISEAVALSKVYTDYKIEGFAGLSLKIVDILPASAKADPLHYILYNKTRLTNMILLMNID